RPRNGLEPRSILPTVAATTGTRAPNTATCEATRARRDDTRGAALRSRAGVVGPALRCRAETRGAKGVAPRLELRAGDAAKPQIVERFGEGDGVDQRSERAVKER